MKRIECVIFLVMISVLVACNDDESDNNDTNGQNKLNTSVLNFGKANPPVEANTPPAFQLTSGSQKSVSFAASFDDCRAEVLTELGITSNEWNDEAENRNNACKAGVDVKGRYFSQSTTEIRAVLGDIDGAIEGYKTRAQNSYVPCTDPNNSAGGTIDSTTYNSYNSISSDTNFTFTDGETFDMGMTYHLSCADPMLETNGENFTRAFGVKDGTTYIYEGGDKGRGMIAKIDANDNVETWLGFGSGPVTWSSSFVQTLGPAAGGDLTYASSTGTAHLKSTASTNTIEMTVTGVGLIEGCDAQFIMNDQYMFILQNQNYYGTCYTDDDGTAADGSIQYIDDNGDATTHTFDPKIANAQYCLDVSGTSATITNYKNCVDADLAICQDTAPAEGATDDGEVDLLSSSTNIALQGQPVSCTGNFSLNRLNRQTIKVHNTAALFTALHSDVEKFEAFSADLPPIDGTFEESSLYMSKDRDATTSSRVGAFCKDVPPLQTSPGSETSKSINEIFTLDLSTLSSADLLKLQEAKDIRMKYFVTHNDTSTLGYADFSATATVDVDGTTKGVPQTFSYVTNATEQTGEIVISDADLSLTSSSVIRITLSGTNQVKCHADVSRMTSTSVAAGLGSPKLFFYNDPAEASTGQ